MDFLNFLFSVNYWPGAIFSSTAVMLLEHYVRKRIDKQYPSGFELQVYEQRFFLYDQLYFCFCVDFDNGTDFSFDENKKIQLDLFVQNRYFQENNLKYLLSNQLQRTIRSFTQNPTSLTFCIFQIQVAIDYKRICETLKFSVYDVNLFSKTRKLDIAYWTFAILNILSTILSIACNNGILVLTSVIFCICVYIIHFCFLQTDI